MVYTILNIRFQELIYYVNITNMGFFSYRHIQSIWSPSRSVNQSPPIILQLQPPRNPNHQNSWPLNPEISTCPEIGTNHVISVSPLPVLMSILIETVENGKGGSGYVLVNVLDHFNWWIWTIILCWWWPKLSSEHGIILLPYMTNVLLHDLTNLVMINHPMRTSESKPDFFFFSKLMSILAWLWNKFIQIWQVC